MLTQPGIIAVLQVKGGADTAGKELLALAWANAPDIPHLDGGQQGIEPLIRQGKNSAMLRTLLGDPVGDLGQGLGGAKADGHRDADLFLDRGPKLAAVLKQRRFVGPRQVDKGLVDGIDLHLGLKLAEHIHDPLGKIAIQGVVGGKNLNLVGRNQTAAFEEGLAHLDAQGLGLVGPGNDAAVVVGEHHYRPTFEPGIEEPFAGDVKVVAVEQGKKGGHSHAL